MKFQLLKRHFFSVLKRQRSKAKSGGAGGGHRPGFHATTTTTTTPQRLTRPKDICFSREKVSDLMKHTCLALSAFGTESFSSVGSADEGRLLGTGDQPLLECARRYPVAEGGLDPAEGGLDGASPP